MTAEMMAPAWMHTQISAEQYDSWSEEQCAGTEVVDGMVIVGPCASKRHNRLARILADALDAAAGPDWNADTDFDVRLQDVPLTNRRPDVVVYRAETIDLTPTRPEHVLLVAEVVSPGSETTDRIVKVDQYAKAGIPFYWRVEQAATGVPIVYTYVLDPATNAYRDGEIFKGRIARAGDDITIVAASLMVHEAERAAEVLAGHGVSAEVVDVRSIRPLDDEMICESVAKTGHLVVADTSWARYGFSAEVAAVVAENVPQALRAPVRRVTPAGLPGAGVLAAGERVQPRRRDDHPGLPGNAALRVGLRAGDRGRDGRLHRPLLIGAC